VHCFVLLGVSFIQPKLNRVGTKQCYPISEFRFIQIPDGKREVSWAGVQGALETANASAFWAKSGPVILPKRAFDGNSISDSTEKPLARGLELLPQMTLGQNEGATTCRVGFVEYELTEVASLWKRRPVAMLRYYGVGFFCSFLLAEGMRHSRGATSCLGLGNRGANSLCDNHRSILVLPRGVSLGTSRYSVLCQRGSLEQAGPRAFCCVGRIQ
jgi:hypothetical protein